MMYQVSLVGDIHIMPEGPMDELSIEVLTNLFCKKTTGVKRVKNQLIIYKSEILRSILNLTKTGAITLDDIHKTIALDTL